LPGVRHFPPDRIDPLRSQDDPEEFPLYGNASYLADGGCIALTREAFASSGGWNPNFVSYGFEDQEFDLRLRRLGRRVERTQGFNLVHLDHPRGRDSRFATFYRQNEAEFERVAAMSPDDLRLYAMRGFRSIAFRHDGDYLRQATPDADGWQRVAPRRVSLATW
jgi:GT2 family glycosyltransferase